ncbi:KAP family NTPase [Pseudoalteromonas sp. MM17-2]|uniref:KAP family NTPase n=1 Tax=Pseudoalteromonas sp. MM17-2 TaxID=2917753 RepID=UPI001EF5C90C|nr:KAP family NTPase [Pseudoalteromonas sp. MM17-2]MCG7542833.1 KAP family NTPase [Pseudoalteromonas sp. MM17-2]
MLDDRYERVSIAENIADKMTKHSSSGRGFGRIALIGAFGTGKTSTLNLLKEKLEKRSNSNSLSWVCVTFDAWGKADSTPNIQGLLLQETISTLSKYIETSSIQNLPDKYLHAFREVHHSTKFIAHFLNNSTSPEVQLNKLDNLLEECRYKICIFIEDMDRNNDVAAAVNSLAPLLDSLKSLKNMSFIFTIGYGEKAHEIISRVTDFRLELPSLNFEGQLRRLSSELRSPKVTYFYEANNTSWALSHQAIYIDDQQIITLPDNILKYISSFISSPREYADIERAMRARWHELKGEINYDDLLILSILGVSTPTVYSFIKDNIETFINFNEETHSNLHIAWKELDLKECGLDKNKLEKVISYIFPTWGQSVAGLPLRMQSISNCGIKDYWRIYLDPGYLQRVDFKDQELFSQMLDFQNSQYDHQKHSFIDRMVGNSQFIDFTRKVQLSKRSFFNQTFWPKVLLAVQSKSNSLRNMTHDTWESYSGESFKAEALLLISTYITTVNPSLKKHVRWAFNISVLYLYALFNRLKKKDIQLHIQNEVRALFLIVSKDRDRLMSFFDNERTALEVIEILIPDRFSSDRNLDGQDRELHKVLIKLLFHIENPRVSLAIYKAILLKKRFRVDKDGKPQSYNDIDYRAFEMLHDEQKVELDYLLEAYDESSSFYIIYKNFLNQ